MRGWLEDLSHLLVICGAPGSFSALYTLSSVASIPQGGTQDFLLTKWKPGPRDIRTMKEGNRLRDTKLQD